MLEITLTVIPVLLILGIGGTVSDLILRIPMIDRWFTSLSKSLPLCRDDVQKELSGKKNGPK